MFTGIIQEIGIITKIIENKGREISVKAPITAKKLKYGDSIAVNGTCQTVTKIDNTAIITFFTMEETLNITNLSLLKTGHYVNIETPLTLNTMLSGHIVMGHIDSMGIVQFIQKNQNSTLITIEVPFELSRYIIKKGSIAIDGISLTVYDIIDNKFTVSIIPTTIKDTTLSEMKVGDKVNIETDMMAKYIEKLINNSNTINNKKNIITEEYLKKYGFYS